MLNPAAFIDHTLLAPTATIAQLVTLCDEAVEYGFRSVCIPPAFVPLAADQLYGSDVKVCSVVGFPCGYNSSFIKSQEAAELISLGADELDMVIAIGSLVNGDYGLVEDEIAAIVEKSEGRTLKVIIECCCLTSEQMKKATELIISAGADYVKTSTGLSTSGATIADVTALAGWAGGRIKINASGGFRTLSDAISFFEAGASRLGCSAGVDIMKEWLVAAR